MVFSEADPTRYAQAFTTIVITIFLVVTPGIARNYFTLPDRPRAHRFLVTVTAPIRHLALADFKPRLAEQKTWIDDHLSEIHSTNGLPPTEEGSAE